MSEDEIIYIAVNCEPFKISQYYKPRKGVFYVVRLLYSIKAQGGTMFKRSVFYILFTFTLTPLCLFIDFVTLIAIATFYILRFLAKNIYSMFKDVFSVILNNYIATFLKLAAIVTIVILIIQKWQSINTIISKLF